MKVFLALGSNQGNRLEKLQEAAKLVSGLNGEIVQKSSIYETAAWGKTDQPDFLNQVIEITSRLNPEELLDVIARIESKLGRQRKEHWGPREIDIDILFYGEEIIDRKGLQIPHPGVPKRRFVLVPMNEIAPGFVHPIEKQSVSYLLEHCSDPLVVRLYKSS